jgi:hypothetical protein
MAASRASWSVALAAAAPALAEGRARGGDIMALMLSVAAERRGQLHRVVRRRVTHSELLR